ncbi:hypothetical protein O181_075344 [Austropuccinia psidii MF-1]|uniref:Uncharacterized protein n=1 Tax=Austropuccinia psidii MF-1 TaxID=1389203 RepID=A0A9Q3IED8_9BASI|nr:hypothetical protein [Austropuccinia psidii MF-1]
MICLQHCHPMSALTPPYSTPAPSIYASDAAPHLCPNPSLCLRTPASSSPHLPCLRCPIRSLGYCGLLAYMMKPITEMGLLAFSANIFLGEVGGNIHIVVVGV